MWKHEGVGPRPGRSVLELPLLCGGLPKAYVFKIANNQETIVHSNLGGNIFVCVCVCVCVYAGIQFGNGYSARVGGLSLSLRWSLLLLIRTQKRDETGADGLGVLRNTNAKGCLITS